MWNRLSMDRLALREKPAWPKSFIFINIHGQ
jgi:hypothetical protein